jgi:hypothetical protein
MTCHCLQAQSGPAVCWPVSRFGAKVRREDLLINWMFIEYLTVRAAGHGVCITVWSLHSVENDRQLKSKCLLSVGDEHLL